MQIKHPTTTTTTTAFSTTTATTIKTINTSTADINTTGNINNNKRAKDKISLVLHIHFFIASKNIKNKNYKGKFHARYI